MNNIVLYAERNDHSPSWGETFTWYSVHPVISIRFDIWDKDIAQDDYLGYAEILWADLDTRPGIYTYVVDVSRGGTMYWTSTVE